MRLARGRRPLDRWILPRAPTSSLTPGPTPDTPAGSSPSRRRSARVLRARRSSATLASHERVVGARAGRPRGRCGGRGGHGARAAGGDIAAPRGHERRSRPRGGGDSASDRAARGEPHGTIEVHLAASPLRRRCSSTIRRSRTNPFVGRFRRDDKPHTLRVEAEGLTRGAPISFATDQTVEIELARADAPRARRPAPPSEAPQRPGQRPKKQLDSDDPWR